MECLNCGCSAENHPYDHSLTKHYGELTRGGCLACNQCALFEDEVLYDEDDCWD
jgi:hypothetical protein